MSSSDPADRRLEEERFLGLEEVCLSNPPAPQVATHSSVPAIYPAAVYGCETTSQADSILGGTSAGYVYQRDGHPNADRLAEKCRQLHHAQRAIITSSGMSSLSAIVLSQLSAGDHILVSNQLYGRSSVLLVDELARLQISCDVFDPSDLSSLPGLVREGQTKILFVETVSNPLLRVVDICQLVEIAKKMKFQVAVDNTFATPYFCRPLELGVDWVWESYSKMLNGHSDLMMGMLCGRDSLWQRVPKVVAAWGLASAPFECYLAERGLMTFGVRMEAASRNASLAATCLETDPKVAKVHYPGLPNHPDYAKVDRCFYRGQTSDKGARIAGNVVTFDLVGDEQSVQNFMEKSGIEYFPSLGECTTTLSHPCTSSHRHLTSAQRLQLGISTATVRLCLGIEPWEVLQRKIIAGLS